jgi:NADH-quinone oxidoreductase subunit L
MPLIWFVLLWPLLGALVNGLLLRRKSRGLAQFIGTLCVGLSFVTAIGVFYDTIVQGKAPQIVYGFPWIEAGTFMVPFELLLDQLSCLMILIITGIGTLIHIYAAEYLHDEKHLNRFYAYLNLFVFMMLLLVLGHNLLVMFVGWEGVGLCSYLLIGYWFENMDNAKAGTKAFLVNRIGDIGFLIGIFLTYQLFHTLNFSQVSSFVHSNILAEKDLCRIGWITLCFFIAACGKSAQLPLYVWLPDAMAGPTPVSALIHAATMVTAGIYMMARLHFLYYLSPYTLIAVAIVGAFTALFAATIALVQTDIKKVLAYSTVSQLGFMVLACGVGAFDAGVFHLLTHACFKALLFLGAGSVIYAMHHEQDMFKMGGLKNYMPITCLSMLVGVLAIMGFPGFSGFFSKDEILWKAFIFPQIGVGLWMVGFLAACCTTFYMVRLFCLTFLGENRSDKKTRSHLHEVPFSMQFPLIILSLLSVFIGYLGVPELISHLVGWHNVLSLYLSSLIKIPTQGAHLWTHLEASYSHSLEWTLMATTVTGSFISAYASIQLYASGPSKRAFYLKSKFASIHQLLLDKYRVDELYAALFINPLREISLFLWKIVDQKIIYWLVQGTGQFFAVISGLTSFRMTGSMQNYAAIFTAFVAIFVFSLMG